MLRKLLMVSYLFIYRRLMSTEKYVVRFAMAFVRASSGLLLSVAQTRTGAGQVISSGLFPAITSSELFRIDPDLGIGMCLGFLVVD